MSDWEDLTPKAVGRGAIKWVFIIVGITLVLGVIGFIVRAVTLPARSALGVAEKTLAPDAIIGNYQWFYDQYNAIQAQKANLASLPLDARERPGLLMVLNSMIGDYNSRSKQINRNLWKAGDLPYQLSLEGVK